MISTPYACGGLTLDRTTLSPIFNFKTFLVRNCWHCFYLAVVKVQDLGSGALLIIDTLQLRSHCASCYSPPMDSRDIKASGLSSFQNFARRKFGNLSFRAFRLSGFRALGVQATFVVTLINQKNEVTSALQKLNSQFPIEECHLPGSVATLVEFFGQRTGLSKQSFMKLHDS